MSDIHIKKLLANYFNIQKSDLIEKHNHKDEESQMIETAKVALFGGGKEVTDEMWNEVKRYAQYIKDRENGN